MDIENVHLHVWNMPMGLTTFLPLRVVALQCLFAACNLYPNTIATRLCQFKSGTQELRLIGQGVHWNKLFPPAEDNNKSPQP